MLPDDAPPLDWSPHGAEVRPWRQTVRGGTRDDRTLRSVTVRLPPLIATAAPLLDGPTTAALEAATRRVTRLDSTHEETLQALGALLLRTESVASSKIESVEADLADYARAMYGSRANPSAVAMVAGTEALTRLIDGSVPGHDITLEAVTAAHRVLMADDRGEAGYAGRLRDMQNWIGGSDHSPRGALYVPPPPETVPGYMDDLLRFVNRDDLPALVQAAVAHAQFESVHPFTDGNGRIGRALVNAVLRRRGVTTRIVVPLATALVAHRQRYFDLLGDYREGRARPLVVAFAAACELVADEAATTAQRLAAIPAGWHAAARRPRAGSAAAKLIAVLPARPVLSSEDACDLLAPAPRSSVFAALARLHEAGVVHPLTDRRRDRIWGATAVLAELDDLTVRVAQASTGR